MRTLLLALSSCLASVILAAEPADIDRALSLAQRTQNKVFRATIRPRWLPDGKSFWYRVQTGPMTHEFVLINAETGARRTAADLQALGVPAAEELRTTKMVLRLRPTRRTGVESGLKFVNRLDSEVDLFWINQQGERVRYGALQRGAEREQHTFEGHVWLVTRRSGEPLAVIEAEATVQTILIDGRGVARVATDSQAPARAGLSPNGQWSVFFENGVVMVRDTKSGGVVPVRTGFEETRPARGTPRWAPDSSAFVVHATAPVEKRRITLVEAAPKGQLYPKPRQLDYVKPGDPLPKPVPVLCRLADKEWQAQPIEPDLFSNPFIAAEAFEIRWAPAASEFYFDYNQRGHQLYRVLAVNAKTAAARVVVEERSPTFIDYTNKTWRHWLWRTGELLWMSERDGWCHLWLYDAQAGAVKNQVTRGAWPVRQVLHVDDERRQVWFYASGLGATEDPYHKHLCRVHFDGSRLVKLTEGDGQHSVEFSPDRRWFIDAWSRADLPPIHELRRAADGSLVCLLERADATELTAAGWTMPERFVAKGRDGKTDIHGVIIKPSPFDAEQKYPVVEEVYAGPQSAFAPKEFGRLLRQQQIAALGFVVVQVDGMGTNHRGKAFHDVCWKDLKDAGFPDRIAWIEAAARTRPWMDLSRVGIYGGSAGGQNALRALLDHHDFYKAAVADCGCHDNRMDKIWWNEQWLGWPVDESYARCSNVADAHKLRGQLLLIVGELDSNVDPASTMQVVAALQKAGKRFEFMPLAGYGHGAAETPYGSRLRMQFLLKHLR